MTLIVHLINKNEAETITYQYERHLDALEHCLRGNSADLVLVHGIKTNKCPKDLFETFIAIAKEKKGAVIFMDETETISELFIKR